MTESTKSSVPSDKEVQKWRNEMKLEVPVSPNDKAVRACRKILDGPDGEWASILDGYSNVKILRRGFAQVCINLGVHANQSMAMNYAYKAGVNRARDWAHSVALGGLPIPDEVFEGESKKGRLPKASESLHVGGLLRTCLTEGCEGQVHRDLGYCYFCRSKSNETQ